MPPERNAMRSAGLLPTVLAACATRTLARVASVMPTKPTSAEKPAPTGKKSDRPTFTSVVPGSRNSRKKTRTAKTARVRNCRFR